MKPQVFSDLRVFIDFLDDQDHLLTVEEVDWEVELGGLSEITWRKKREDCPALLFDNIKDYPAGYRVLTLGVASTFHYTAATNLTPTTDRRKAVKALKDRVKPDPVSTEVVSSGPVTENIIDDGIDVTKFPAPRYKEGEGGRFIGTGDYVITRDREGGELNMGTYRVQVHGPETVTVYMAPGRDGFQHVQSYHEAGEPAPVVISLGQAPDLFLSACERFPRQASELEMVGGRRGEAVEIVEGEITGLPFASTSEIVLEGHIDPDSESIDVEGPFGEVFGYYAGVNQDVTPLTVERIYHRDDPIILGVPHHRPPQDVILDFRIAPRLWKELEESGIPGIGEVNSLPFGSGMCNVVSINSQYPGHSTQVGMQVASSQTAYLLGYWTIVVDDDIDVFDQDHVMWAVMTRCNPENDLHVVNDMLSFPLDPVTHDPDKQNVGDVRRPRVVVDATRPMHWREKFPDSTDIDPELRNQLEEKWKEELFDKL